MLIVEAEDSRLNPFVISIIRPIVNRPTLDLINLARIPVREEKMIMCEDIYTEDIPALKHLADGEGFVLCHKNEFNYCMTYAKGNITVQL